MKKLWIMIFCLLLCACSNKQTEKKIEENPKKEETSQRNLQYVNLSEGYGSEDGYYHLVMVDDEGSTPRNNIRYFDYASKQEVYLCDKPECAHDNDRCTSYIPMGGLISLFVAGSHLYLLENPSYGNMVLADGSVKKGEGKPSVLYQMDFDGKNKKVLCTLDTGFEFESTNIALGKEELYIVASKTDLISTGDNSSTGIKTDSFLFHMNLANGKMKKVQNMKDKFMVGAKHHTILLQNLHYAQDLDALLQKKEFDLYEQVAQQATTSYQQFNTFENKLEKEFTTNENFPSFDGTYAYYLTQQGALCKLDIESQKAEVLAQLEPNYTYVLSTDIIDDHLIIETWEKGTENPSYIKSFVYTLKDSTLKENTLMVKGVKEPLHVLGTMEKDYFLLYRKDVHMETTWANTQQLTVDKAFYGIISKNDFWNNIEQFEDISSISE